MRLKKISFVNVELENIYKCSKINQNCLESENVQHTPLNIKLWSLDYITEQEILEYFSYNLDLDQVRIVDARCHLNVWYHVDYEWRPSAWSEVSTVEVSVKIWSSDDNVLQQV